MGAPARYRKTSQPGMLSSASFRQRRRDCLRQPPIEAQPLPGQRCGTVVPRPRNVSVPSCRPIQRAGSRSTHRVQLCGGLGGGAEQPSSLTRVPDVLRTVAMALPRTSGFALYCFRLHTQRAQTGARGVKGEAAQRSTKSTLDASRPPSRQFRMEAKQQGR